MKNNNKKDDTKIINIVTSIMGILLIVLTVSLMYAFYKSNVLKLSYIIVIGIIVLLIDTLLIVKLENKNKSKYKRYVTSFISLIFVFIYGIIISYIIDTVKFVSNISKINNYEYQTYSVMVPDKSNIKNIKELDDKIIGFISNSTYLKESKETLSKKAKIAFKSKDYEDTASIINALNNNNDINAITFENTYVELLKENNSDVFNDLRVIYTYKVKIKVNKKMKESSSFDITNNSFVVYISGSDSRGKLSDTARSDVNIVAVVNPKTNKILLVSIPRDYYIQLHGTTGVKDKLTHAGIYGVDMSKNTISDLLDTNIDYYLKVGFDTVTDLVDVIGGIDVYSDQVLNLKGRNNKKCDFYIGTNSVDGACALAFARERKSYTSGDRHRGENQQEIITAIIEKISSNPSILVKYKDILKALDSSFETNMSYEDITTLIKEELTSLTKWEVESISLDGTGSSESTYSMGSQKLYVMIPDETTVNNAKEKINEYLQK